MTTILEVAVGKFFNGAALATKLPNIYYKIL
jgi:hypothetical protein